MRIAYEVYWSFTILLRLMFIVIRVWIYLIWQKHRQSSKHPNTNYSNNLRSRVSISTSTGHASNRLSYISRDSTTRSSSRTYSPSSPSSVTQQQYSRLLHSIAILPVPPGFAQATQGGSQELGHPLQADLCLFGLLHFLEDCGQLPEGSSNASSS